MTKFAVRLRYTSQVEDLDGKRSRPSVWVSLVILSSGVLISLINRPLVTTKAVDFDGKDDFVRVRHAADLSPPLLTLAFWIRTRQTGVGFLFSKHVEGKTGYEAHLNGNGGVRFLVHHGKGRHGYTAMDTVVRINDGRWHHIAFRFDAGRMAVFIDGIADPNDATSPIPRLVEDKSEFLIGNRYNEALYLKGALSDMRLWDRPLPTSTIAVLAYLAPPIPGRDRREVGLRAQWSFDERTGPFLADRKGGHHGRLFGNPSIVTRRLPTIPEGALGWLAAYDSAIMVALAAVGVLLLVMRLPQWLVPGLGLVFVGGMVTFAVSGKEPVAKRFSEYVFYTLGLLVAYVVLDKTRTHER